MSWDIPIGTQFAGYKITDVLGRGGMSVVYAAEHVSLGRMVALKLLAPQLATNESFRERFIRESQLAASLDHPNIIPIYDAGESEGFLYIIMRHVEGPDLRSLIEQEGPLPLGQTLFYMEQVARALDQAHERGLVHRDVKPGNILIAKPSDRVYLTDFGVVKETSSRGLTKTGFFLGTFEYAAPEQIEGKAVDGRTDLYALGCVLYECLSGEPPFDAQTEGSIIHAHLTEPPPKLTTKRPDLPMAMNDVVATAMSKAKEERYGTCADMARAIRNAAFGESLPEPATTGERPPLTVPPRPETVGAPVGADPKSEATGTPPEWSAAEPAPPGSPREPRSVTLTRGKLIGAGAAVAALVAIAVVVAAVVSGGNGGKKATPGGTTGTTGATKAGLAGIVPPEIFKYCTVAKSPRSGATQTANCQPPADTGGVFYPTHLEISTYATGADASREYEALRTQAKDVGQNFGRCVGNEWNGEGPWNHPAALGGKPKPGGRRFCYFSGLTVAQIVWTHRRLGQGSHRDMLGIASANESRNDELSSWFSFWRNKIGKCPQKDCVLK